MKQTRAIAVVRAALLASVLFAVVPDSAQLLADGAAAAGKKVVFLAGPPSHGYGCHEHHAGCCLLAKALQENVPGMETVVYREGWPKNATDLDDADTIVVDCDGGRILVRHLQELDKLMKKGVGLVCIHYTVSVPKEKPGRCMLDWLGGYYELWWSVNPVWTAEFKTLPEHPITRGVKPFTIKDEWYYHMRFRETMEGVTPILTAVPPDSTRKRKDGPHSNNPHVRARMGMPEHTAWAYERPGGGRGFGFTGGHWHWNWAHDDFRRLVLNAIVWTAGAEVPPEGVPTKMPTVADLEANADFEKPKNWKPERIQKMIEEFNRTSGQ